MLRRGLSYVWHGVWNAQPGSSLASAAAAAGVQHQLASCSYSVAVDYTAGHQLPSQVPAHIGDFDLPGPAHPADNIQLCSVPKRRHSIHKRGQRRVWYKVDRQQVVAKCKFCGTVSLPHEFSAHKPSCSGRCLQGLGKKQYPQEYEPPC